MVYRTNSVNTGAGAVSFTGAMSFWLRIYNEAPVVASTISAQTHLININTWALTLSNIFNEPNSETMTYRAFTGDGDYLPDWL